MIWVKLTSNILKGFVSLIVMKNDHVILKVMSNFHVSIIAMRNYEKCSHRFNRYENFQEKGFINNLRL